MKAMRAIAAVIVIAALFACKKKATEEVPDAAPSAPPLVEIDAAPPTPLVPETVDAAVDAGVYRPVTVVKKDGGTTDAGQTQGQGGAGSTAVGGSAGLAANAQCVGNCVKKFGECIAAAKDLEANKKCRTDMVACRKTCTGF